jgi:hypothetical protein
MHFYFYSWIWMLLFLFCFLHCLRWLFSILESTCLWKAQDIYGFWFMEAIQYCRCIYRNALRLSDKVHQAR